MANRFNDQVVVVTGGAEGIGQAIATYFKQEGARVCVLDHKIKPSCDVADPVQVQQAVAEIVAQHQRIDVLVANAGIQLLSSLEQTSAAALQQLFATNVFGVFYSVQAVLPIMRQQRYGRIVLMSSEQGLIGRSLGAAYGMSKAALIQLAKCASTEMAAHNILINALCPSTVADTGLTRYAAEYFAKEWNLSIEATLKRFAQEQLTGKLISLQEVTYWVSQLCARENQSMTGAAVILDGGVSVTKL